MLCRLDFRAQYKLNSMHVVRTFSAEVTRSTNKATNHTNLLRLIIPRELKKKSVSTGEDREGYTEGPLTAQLYEILTICHSPFSFQRNKTTLICLKFSSTSLYSYSPPTTDGFCFYLRFCFYHPQGCFNIFIHMQYHKL